MKAIPPRYVRRHLLILSQPPKTRRQRKAYSKSIRLYLAKRGNIANGVTPSVREGSHAAPDRR